MDPSPPTAITDPEAADGSPLALLRRYVPGPGALLGLVLVAAPLLIGGVHTVTRMGLTAVATAALVWLSLTRRRSLQIDLVGLGILMVLVWTFVQWVPLPSGLVDTLAPAAGRAHQAAAEALGGEAPGWYSLSLDSSRTAEAWLSLLGFFAVFAVALNLSGSSEERRRIAVYVEIAALTVFVLGVFHTVTGADRIFGAYQASVDTSRQHFLTSFVNPNHSAALMLLGSCSALGLWLSSDHGLVKHLHLGAALLLALGTAATGSRAGTALIAASYVVITLLAAFGSASPQQRTQILRVTAAAGCLAFIAFVVFGSEAWIADVTEGLDGDPLNAPTSWTVGASVAFDHVFTGVGHGALPVATPVHIESWLNGYVNYAHNAEIQAVADWGLPVTLAAGAAVVVGMVRAGWAVRRRMDRLAVTVGLVALFVHNQVDFSLLIPGVGYPAAALAGWVVGHRYRKLGGADAGLSWFKAPRLRFSYTGSLIAVAAFAVAAAHAHGESPARAKAQMRAALDDDKPGRVKLAAILETHPSDFDLWRLGTTVAGRQGEVELARRLGDRALALAPDEPNTLLERARVDLRQDDAERALPLLLKLAGIDKRQLEAATREVIAYRHLKPLFEGFFGHDPEHVRAGASLLRASGDVQAVEWLLGWAATRHPDSVDILVELATIWEQQPEGRKRLDKLSVDMLAQATEAPDEEKARRFKQAGYFFQGLSLRHQGKLLEAWVSFEEAARQVPEQAGRPLVEAGWALVKLARFDQLQGVLIRLEPLADDERMHRPPYYLLRSHQAEARGDLDGAIRAVKQSLVYSAHSKLALGRLAYLYEKIGDSKSADQVRQRIAERRSPKGDKR